MLSMFPTGVGAQHPASAKGPKLLQIWLHTVSQGLMSLSNRSLSFLPRTPSGFSGASTPSRSSSHCGVSCFPLCEGRGKREERGNVIHVTGAANTASCEGESKQECAVTPVPCGCFLLREGRGGRGQSRKRGYANRCSKHVHSGRTDRASMWHGEHSSQCAMPCFLTPP